MTIIDQVFHRLSRRVMDNDRFWRPPPARCVLGIAGRGVTPISNLKPLYLKNVFGRRL